MLCIEIETRSRYPDELRQCEQLFPILPGKDAGQRIGTGDEEEFGVRVVGPEVSQRVHGVRHFFTVDVDPRDGKPRVGGGGDDRHEVPVLGRTDALPLLLPGPPGGDEDHFVESEPVGDLTGRNEVAMVNGVEGATHHS